MSRIVTAEERNKYYNGGPEGVLYFDGSSAKDEELMEAALNSKLHFIGHQVEPGPTVPRLVTRLRRAVGHEAVIDFLNNPKSD